MVKRCSRIIGPSVLNSSSSKPLGIVTHLLLGSRGYRCWNSLVIVSVTQNTRSACRMTNASSHWSQRSANALLMDRSFWTFPTQGSRNSAIHRTGHTHRRHKPTRWAENGGPVVIMQGMCCRRINRRPLQTANGNHPSCSSGTFNMDTIICRIRLVIDCTSVRELDGDLGPPSWHTCVGVAEREAPGIHFFTARYSSNG